MRVEVHDLRGSLPTDGVVFTGHTYVSRDDVFDLVGIYATYDAAKKAGGDRAMVKNAPIDGRT